MELVPVLTLKLHGGILRLVKWRRNGIKFLNIKRKIINPPKLLGNFDALSATRSLFEEAV